MLQVQKGTVLCRLDNGEKSTAKTAVDKFEAEKG